MMCRYIMAIFLVSFVIIMMYYIIIIICRWLRSGTGKIMRTYIMVILYIYIKENRDIAFIMVIWFLLSL